MTRAVRATLILSLLIVVGLLAACGENPPGTTAQCYPDDLGRPAAQRDVVTIDISGQGGTDCPAGFTNGPQINPDGTCTDDGIKAGTCHSEPIAQPPPHHHSPPPVNPETVTNPHIQTTPCHPGGGISDLPPCPP